MKEKLFFENSKEARLCGILSSPTSDSKNRVIILCHGFATGKDGNTYVNLEKILNDSGISTFRFDFFGHGESEGKIEEITTSEAVDDILNAVRFLKNSGYKRIGLFGSSFGGLASIISASKTNDLYLLALKSPVSDYSSLIKAREDWQDRQGWKKKGFTYFTTSNGEKLKLNYSFFEDAEKVNGYRSARKIKLPTLIVHGSQDETVPVEQSKRTASLIANCSLEIIEGADHRYSRPEEFEKMLDLISQFILRNS